MADWERDFRYLTAPRTRPSADDLYNSLRIVMEKEQAAALAGLFIATFDRIIGIEAPIEPLDLAALSTIYRALLAHPHDGWRAKHQKSYCLIRDAIAQKMGESPDSVQLNFERGGIPIEP